MVPIRRATANHLIVSPPMRIKAINIKIMVKELLSDLTIVSLIALFASSKTVPENFFFDSRIRSYTTIVSWTEKDKTVSIAVTKRKSISAPRKCPKRENEPKRTRLS